MNYKRTPITWEIPRVSEALSQQPRVKWNQFSVIQQRYMQAENTKQQADTEDAPYLCCAECSMRTARHVCRGWRSDRKQGWDEGTEREGQREGEREKAGRRERQRQEGWRRTEGFQLHFTGG